MLALLGYGVVNPLFLASLRDIETARGLITFLFAVGTIGIFVVVISAIFVGNLEDPDQRFGRGKDTLSMLIGIFGTILGFYFSSAGNEATVGGEASQSGLDLQTALIHPEQPVAGGRVAIRLNVKGGTPPYHYFINFDPPSDVPADTPKVLLKNTNGLIYHEFDLPSRPDAFALGYQIVVIDAEATSGNLLDGTIAVKPFMKDAATPTMEGSSKGS